MQKDHGGIWCLILVFAFILPFVLFGNASSGILGGLEKHAETVPPKLVAFPADQTFSVMPITRGYNGLHLIGTSGGGVMWFWKDGELIGFTPGGLEIRPEKKPEKE